MKNRELFEEFKFNSKYCDIKNAIEEVHAKEMSKKRMQSKLKFMFLCGVATATTFGLSFLISYSVRSNVLKNQNLEKGYMIKVPNSINVLENDYILDLETNVTSFKTDKLIEYIIPSKDYLKDIDSDNNYEIVIDERVDEIIEVYSIIDISFLERVLIKTEIELFTYTSNNL